MTTDTIRAIAAQAIRANADAEVTKDAHDVVLSNLSFNVNPDMKRKVVVMRAMVRDILKNRSAKALSNHYRQLTHTQTDLGVAVTQKKLTSWRIK